MENNEKLKKLEEAKGKLEEIKGLDLNKLKDVDSSELVLPKQIGPQDEVEEDAPIMGSRSVYGAAGGGVFVEFDKKTGKRIK